MCTDRPIKVYEQNKQATRRIIAESVVRAPPDVVWKVLTDYEALPQFVPNLERCEKLPPSASGRSAGRGQTTLIRQVACSHGGLWRLEAEAVLEVEELMDASLGRREARFRAISGDFVQLRGRWIVEPDPSSPSPVACLLRYDLTIQPRLPLPAAIVSYVVRAGLPANIRALVVRAEQLAEDRLKASGLAGWAGVEEDPVLPGARQDGAYARNVATDVGQMLPEKGPFWPAGSFYAASAPITATAQRRRAERSAYLGTTSVPLPPAFNDSASFGQEALLQASLNKKLQEKENRLQELYPAFGLIDGGGEASLREGASRASRGNDGGGELSDEVAPSRVPPNATLTLASPFSLGGCVERGEVHLRRLDDLHCLHRRAVSAIDVEAPMEILWEVLTDYDRLAEFVPNLAVSERIKLPASAPSNIIRVRQVGYKRVPYIYLHAESVLDLIEKPYSEIQFRQVDGDFEHFQGKWMLSDSSSGGGGGASFYNLANSSGKGQWRQQIQLKYAVEIIIPRSIPMIGMIEPVLERVVFEDVPANMVAIKRRAEELFRDRLAAELRKSGNDERAALLKRRWAKPRLSEMIEDFGVLAMELDRLFGDQQKIPTRQVLRKLNRTDIEKAISAHGGPAAIASRLGWSLQAKKRKPRGYWDSLENVKSEIEDFIIENGLEPGVMPLKNDFVRAERFDLARAIERWGGLYDLAEDLDYRIKPPAFSSTEWQEHISEVAASTGLSGKQGLFELAARTYRHKDMTSLEIRSAEAEKRAKNTRQRKGKVSKMPSVREEIDNW